MPWLGYAALALASWFIFIRREHGRWVHTDTSGLTHADKPGPGEWTTIPIYQSGNKQLWFVSKTPTGFAASTPGTGGYVTADTLDELTSRMDDY